MIKLGQAPLRTGYIPCSGGLDVETPPLSVEPGYCSDALNVYQGVNGGYTVWPGYDRFDGQPSPILASYIAFDVVVEDAVSTGTIVTDGYATGVVLGLYSNELTADTELTYETDMGQFKQTLYVTDVTGTFYPGDLYIGAVKIGEIVSDQFSDSAPTVDLHTYYKALAADYARENIYRPPGAGPTLGGKYFKGALYVFRDNTLHTEAHLWKSTATGWEQVPLGVELSFTSGGTYEPQEDDVITGATSGATAIIKRVVHEDGIWAAGTATGRFIVTTQVGTFQAEELHIGSGPHLNNATITGDPVEITLLPGGKYRFVVANFTGSPQTRRMYGVDGVNYGFEFDGEYFVQIHTGMEVDRPSHLVAHADHLIYAFDGSMQNSSLGLPYQWEPVLGAAEIGLSDSITNFIVQPGTESTPVLAITSRNSINILYGSTRDDWSKISFKFEAGAIADSAQLLGQTFMLDDRGLTSMAVSQAFGNFSAPTLSKRIKRWLNAKYNILNCSCVIREKNLYCLFFNDGTALACTIGVTSNGASIITASMPLRFPHTIKWIDSAEAEDGSEVIYFGDSDGMVYQFSDISTSFDGNNLEWKFILHYVNFKSPNTEKKYRKATVELTGSGYAEYDFGYRLGYQSGNISQPSEQSDVISMTAKDLDTDFDLDSDYLDGEIIKGGAFDLCGNAENISMTFRGGGISSYPITINGILVLYSLAREKR